MKSTAFYVMRPEESSYIGLRDMIESIEGTENMTMIEIGSYIGESTIVFADYFKEVISIDPFINDYDPTDVVCNHADFNLVYKKFLENTTEFDNITHIRKTSNDAFDDLLFESVDFVYIDGCHTYEQVKQDIINYINLVKPNGYIGGHDYTGNWPGVVRAIKEVVGEVDKIFMDGSWIKRKPSD